MNSGVPPGLLVRPCEIDGPVLTTTPNWGAVRLHCLDFTLTGVKECGSNTQDLIWACPWRASAWAFRPRNSPWMKSVKVFLISN